MNPHPTILVVVFLVAAAQASSATATLPSGAQPAHVDVAFCREVSILHHNHVDVGYAYPPMYDNSPPNQDLPGLIHQWNEAGRRLRLRQR